MFLRVFLREMFFRLRFIIGQLREWTTPSKSRQSAAGELDIALLIEEKLILVLNRLFTSNRFKVLREQVAYHVCRD